MIFLCQIIFTGYPVSHCNTIRKPLFNFEEFSKEKHCWKSDNCLVYWYRCNIIRVTKSGCIKVHLPRCAIATYNTVKKQEQLLEDFVKRVSKYIYKSNIYKYQFSANNVQFKGDIPTTRINLIKFCFNIFQDCKISLGVIDSNSIVWSELNCAPQHNVSFTKLQIKHKNYTITVYHTSRLTGVATSIDTFNFLKVLLEIEYE